MTRSAAARSQPGRSVGPVAWLLVWPIRFYQRFISRYTPPTCRYYPCCSSYAIDALRTHGAAKGLVLATCRLVRCNPWSSGGIDRVPARGRWRRESDVDRDDVIPMFSDAAGSGVIDTSASAPVAGAPTAGRTAA